MRMGWMIPSPLCKETAAAAPPPIKSVGYFVHIHSIRLEHGMNKKPTDRRGVSSFAFLRVLCGGGGHGQFQFPAPLIYISRNRKTDSSRPAGGGRKTQQGGRGRRRRRRASGVNAEEPPARFNFFELNSFSLLALRRLPDPLAGGRAGVPDGRR